MFLDIFTIILLLLAVVKGWRNGLIVGVFSFLAYLIGLAAAIKLSAVAAEYIGKNVTISERWLPFVAFAAVFIAVVILVRLGARMIQSLVQLVQLGWLNRLGGIVLYVLIYLFVFSILLFYAAQIKIIKEETLQASVAYRYINPLAPGVINSLGYILPFFKNMFVELQAFFNQD